MTLPGEPGDAEYPAAQAITFYLLFLLFLNMHAFNRLTVDSEYS